MTRRLRLLAGPWVSLQDLGRPGHARHGVSAAGPMDPLTHRLAVRLAGARSEQLAARTAIEVGPGGARLAVEGDVLDLAVAGPGALLHTSAGAVSAPAVVRVDAGEEVEVGGRARWATLCPVDADLRVAAVLGSTSLHGRTGTGPAWPIDTALELDEAPRGASRGEARAVLLGERPSRRGAGDALLLLPAPQTHLFDESVRARLTADGITIASAGDRMAQRLDGVRLQTRGGGHDVVSDAIVAGAVQVQGDGSPWVLAAEHPPTGGYPKVAVLAAADRGRLAQLEPGATVRFRWAGVDEARRRWRDALAAIEEVVASSPTPSADRLRRAEVAGHAADAVVEPADDHRRT